MSLYSLTKFFLKLILASLLTCTVSIFIGSIPFGAWWPQHSAMAASDGNRSAFHTDQADFSKSEMRYLETKVRELDLLSYEIILRNTGGRRPEYVKLGSDLSAASAAMLASASPDMIYDNRYLSWQGNVEPGEERRFIVKLITLPGSYDNLIISHATITWDGGEKNLQVETKVKLPEETRLDQFLFVAGGIGFRWLEVLMVAYLLFIPFFMIVVLPLVRRRERQRFEQSPNVSWHDKDPHRIKHKAMSIVLLLSLAFMPLFISEAIDDLRRFVSYEKTTCTILDKKADWLPGSRGGHPLIAVRYAAGGKEIISTGSLAKGASTHGTSADKKIAIYDYGKSYACWFDPNDPKKFVLKRGDITWGLYLLFLPPLLLAIITSRYFLRRLRGPDSPGGISKTSIHPG
jgi:hypothetical protein